MKKTIFRILKWICIIILIPILYVVGSLIHGTVTDFQPEEVIPLSIDQQQENTVVTDSILSFTLWNVGYGGLGAKSNFFYDNGGFLTDKGKMVRSPKEYVEEYVGGAAKTIDQFDSDFYLLQEVDFDSKRSYHINQYEKYKEVLPGYASTFAVNYKSQRVPLPVLQPWKVMGKMTSGLGTYSKYTPTKATRYQLPGEYDWPTKIFQLDRCAAFHRYGLPNGKELVVVNVHNSAYDKGGKLKKMQMDYLKEKFQTEYQKGNYLVIGGDWNQRPFGVDPKSFGGATLNGEPGKMIPENFLPPSWTWAFDPKIPTNRALKDKFQKGETPVNLIDFFLLSPNMELVEIFGTNLEFAYSDHQPVTIKVKFK